MIEQIKEGFINETIHDLNSIELDLTTDKLGDVSDCLVEKVFTAVHKIKGTAPMLGINGVDGIGIFNRTRLSRHSRRKSFYI